MEQWQLEKIGAKRLKYVAIGARDDRAPSIDMTGSDSKPDRL
jgi:hypothetical protein